jgi:transglutaminase-like putative cysteine protease
VDSYNEVRLMPLTDSSQRCLSFDLQIRPYAKVFSYPNTGGMVHHFSIREPHSLLEVHAVATVETYLLDPFAGVDLVSDDMSFYRDEAVRQANVEFLGENRFTPFLPEVRDLVGDLHQPSMSAASFLIALNGYLHSFLSYDPDVTHVYSTLEDVIAARGGVCQDFAHFALACCRSAGIPAKYVSGYLYGGPGSSVRGELATHAWIECLLPGGRWLALDPTNNLLAGENYIRVHVGRDYTDVSPTRGTYLGCPASKLEVSVRVVELHEVAALA